MRLPDLIELDDMVKQMEKAYADVLGVDLGDYEDAINGATFSAESYWCCEKKLISSGMRRKR